jgi:glycerol kinase
MDAKTDAMGPVLRAATREAGCRGAALFAGIAAGTYRDLDETPAATLAD